MVETVRGGLLRRPAPPVFCPGPALREGPAEPFLPGAELEEEPGTAPGCPNAPPPGGRGRVQTGLWSVRAGSVWRVALGCLSPEPKNPLPGQGWGVCLRRDPAGPGPQAAHWGPWLGKLRPGTG
ncbi:hypothetical protein NDU88_004121 [Pleurodeles waltl]|uniref:Uncharacterized protein n=1 Tax=Pleurodeles waltl TaxID=8319 RepID=A0AAV7V232_PLEWA|nr:hypothetical protein NDU88_004121 [Pleurodeles waltl]